MGLSLLTIVGGFAKAASEDIEKEEKLATERGSLAAKSLYENYKKANEENLKKAQELAADMAWLKDKDPNAPPEMFAEIAKNRPFMEFIKNKAKSENFDPSILQLSKFVKLSEEMPTASKIEMLDGSIKATNEMFKKQDKTGNMMRDLLAKSRERAYETSMRETLGGVKATPEEMQAAIEKRGQPMTSRAQIDYSYFKKERTFEQRESDAKVALMDAMKANDPKKINEAKADILVINTIKAEMTPTQTQFANKIADIKNRYMFGTPEERAKAKPEYDKLLSDIRAEAAAKKAGEGKDDKIPALGTLNTFTSSAVAKAVASKYGDKIGNGIAFVEKQDGSTDIRITMTDPALRKEIRQTAHEAAKSALSLYTDDKGVPLTRDVASVINAYDPARMPEPSATQPAQQPAKPGAPAPAKPAVNISRERALAQAAIAAQPENAETIKASFKQRTGQDY